MTRLAIEIPTEVINQLAPNDRKIVKTAMRESMKLIAANLVNLDLNSITAGDTLAIQTVDTPLQNAKYTISFIVNIDERSEEDAEIFVVLEEND